MSRLSEFFSADARKAAEYYRQQERCKNFTREQFPYLQVDNDPYFNLTGFALGLLPWEKREGEYTGHRDWYVEVPEKYKWLTKLGKNENTQYATGGELSQIMSKSIIYLDQASQNSVKEEIIDRAARIGVPFYDGQLAPHDFEEYQKLVREYRSGLEKSRIKNQKDPYWYYLNFTQENRLDFIPVELQSMFDNFLRMRTELRVDALRVRKGRFREGIGRSVPVNDILSDHIIFSLRRIKILKDGLIDNFDEKFQPPTKLTLKSAKRRSLIKELDDTTELIYDFFASPLHSDMILNAPQNGEYVHTAASILQELLVKESHAAGIIGTLANVCCGQRKREILWEEEGR